MHSQYQQGKNNTKSINSNKLIEYQLSQTNEFDGKRLRKSVARKTIDYNSSILNYLEARVWQRDFRDQRAIQTDCLYYPQLMPPMYLNHNLVSSVTTKFVRAATNKTPSPIFCASWTPGGRRLVTGANSGEFTLWNGLTFNFETISQAHDSAVRSMVWSHDDRHMLTGDHTGYVKYWQPNMNNCKLIKAHCEAVREISFCSTDEKFATGSDDGSIKIWDFLSCCEESVLTGHGADINCVDWHPQKSVIVSGSKDSQQPIKLWDSRSGQCICTLHAHKCAVADLRWNQNGNWLLSAARDSSIKLFDIRNLSTDVRTFRSNKCEFSALSWHPIHESLFSSGTYNGCIKFWSAGSDKEIGVVEKAHESAVWALAWHPLGHILCSGSNDHSIKFWTRNRPGDKMLDKYNLNIVKGGNVGVDQSFFSSVITGLDSVNREYKLKDEGSVVIGLDLGSSVKGNKTEEVRFTDVKQVSSDKIEFSLLPKPINDSKIKIDLIPKKCKIKINLLVKSDKDETKEEVKEPEVKVTAPEEKIDKITHSVEVNKNPRLIYRGTRGKNSGKPREFNDQRKRKLEDEYDKQRHLGNNEQRFGNHFGNHVMYPTDNYYGNNMHPEEVYVNTNGNKRGNRGAFRGCSKRGRSGFKK